MAIIENPAAYIRPNMKFMSPAAGTEQAIVRQELDNYLQKLPAKQFNTVAEQQAALVPTNHFDQENIDLFKTSQQRMQDLVNQQQAQGKFTNLTPDDAAWLGTYQGNDLTFGKINAAMRGEDYNPVMKNYIGTSGDVGVASTRNILDVMQDLPTHQGVVYRGMALPQQSVDNLTNNVGRTFTTRQIDSTSQDKAAAEMWSSGSGSMNIPTDKAHVVLEIQSKYGRATPDSNQQEVVMMPGTRYQIMGSTPASGGLNPEQKDAAINTLMQNLHQEGLSGFSLEDVPTDFNQFVASKSDFVNELKNNPASYNQIVNDRPEYNLPVDKPSGITTIQLQDMGTPIDRAVDYQQQTSSIGSRPSGLIGAANRLGQAQAQQLKAQQAVDLVNAATAPINPNPNPNPSIAPAKQAKFVIDKASGQVQSFVNKGDGFTPYKTMSIDDARTAYANAKAKGWDVSHEFA